MESFMDFVGQVRGRTCGAMLAVRTTVAVAGRTGGAFSMMAAHGDKARDARHAGRRPLFYSARMWTRTPDPAPPRAACAAALLLAALTPASAAPPAHEHETDPKALTVVAEIALERGDCLAAADGYARAAAASPLADLAKRATEVGVACEQWPIAQRAAERWRALAPQDASAVRAAGLVTLKLYRIAEARAAFSELLTLAGKDAERTLIELVPLAAQTSSAGAALRALQDSASAPGSSANMLVVAGALAFEADNFTLARDLALRAAQLDPKSADALALLAQVRVGTGDAEGALAAARQAMELAPAAQRFRLAETLTDLDHLEEARKELERLQTISEARVEAERRLALLAFRTGDLVEARQRFEQIYGRRESSTEALYYLSVLAELSGDTDAALSGYEQLASSDAGPLARSRAAALLMRGGNRERAFEVLEDVSSRAPRSAVDVMIEKAQLLANSGAATEAVQLLDEGLARYPAHPQLSYERATALERAGRVREAVSAFEGLVKQRPGDPVIQNALGYTLADHKLELPHAEGLIREALVTAPDSAAVIDSLGWVRFRRGASDQAAPLLERAYRIGRDPEIAAHWGEVLWTMGKKSDARAVWARALAQSPQSDSLKAIIARFSPTSDPAPSAKPASSDARTPEANR
jgi:tetratricopeptide (TPR) repeat protein